MHINLQVLSFLNFKIQKQIQISAWAKSDGVSIPNQAWFQNNALFPKPVFPKVWCTW